MRIPKRQGKYLDISTKYLDIFTIPSLCVSVCVEWERVSGLGSVSSKREKREAREKALP